MDNPLAKTYRLFGHRSKEWKLEQQQPVNDLVMKIGAMILRDQEYADDRWNSIALIGDLARGRVSMTGYQYLDGDTFAPAVPFNDEILDKMEELRAEMKKIKGTEWHKCLIQIAKPDFDIDVEFEYDDPDRWSLKAAGLDVTAFALSLRPGNEPRPA